MAMIVPDKSHVPPTAVTHARKSELPSVTPLATYTVPYKSNAPAMPVNVVLMYAAVPGMFMRSDLPHAVLAGGVPGLLTMELAVPAPMVHVLLQVAGPPDQH